MKCWICKKEVKKPRSKLCSAKCAKKGKKIQMVEWNQENIERKRAHWRDWYARRK